MKAILSFGLAATLVLAPTEASASPWNVQPDGTITVQSNSLTFRYVSRSAGFTHSFGLYSMAYALSGPFVFVFPPTDPVGTTKVVAQTPGSTFLFGLQVTQNGMTWFSDGTSNPVLGGQSIKFQWTPLDDYTTRIAIEDLPNDGNTCYNTSPAFTELCDYNDMVVDVTNTPEPATMALLATGLIGMAGAGFVRRRRSTRH